MEIAFKKKGNPFELPYTTSRVNYFNSTISSSTKPSLVATSKVP